MSLTKALTDQFLGCNYVRATGFRSYVSSQTLRRIGGGRGSRLRAGGAPLSLKTSAPQRHGGLSPGGGKTSVASAPLTILEFSGISQASFTPKCAAFQ